MHNENQKSIGQMRITVAGMVRAALKNVPGRRTAVISALEKETEVEKVVKKVLNDETRKALDSLASG